MAIETPLNLPNWVDTLTITLLALGFPVALIFAWAFELTPEGIKTTKSVVPADSIRQVTGQKLNYIIIALLTLALTFVVLDNYVLDRDSIDEQGRLSNSVAILPCANLSPDPDNAYFAAGIHESMLNQLAKIRDLTVMARTSVLQFENDPPPIPEIAEALNVEMVMECSVRYANDSVMISAQLIDGRTGAHVWSDEFLRGLTDIFAIQAEIAENIAMALEAEILPSELQRIQKVQTQNTRAYEFYLSGKEYVRRRDDTRLVIQQYERAVEEDPNFALAFAALSRAHTTMYWFDFDRSDERLNMAKEAVERAFEIEPDLPEAHIAMGYYYYQGFRDYANALREFEIAEKGIPADPELLDALSAIYRRRGDWDRALQVRAQAIESDPRNIDRLWNHAVTYKNMRNYTEAEKILDRALEIQPDSVSVYLQKARIPLWRNGDVSSSLEIVESAPIDFGEAGHRLKWQATLYDRDYETAHLTLEAMPADALEGLFSFYNRASMRGLAFQLAGQTDLAIPQYQIARTQIDAALQTSPEDYRLYIALGEALAGLGEKEAATRAAERALEIMSPSLDALDGRRVQKDAIVRVLIPASAYDRALEILDEYLSVPGGEWSIEGLLPDPRFDPIRDDSRFVALVEKYKRQ